jgi:hypothetical protein
MTRSAITKIDKKSWLNGELVTYGGLIWSALALVIYFTFSAVDATSSRPLWFILATTGFEEIALLGSGYLCWRNWRNENIPSGRGVWLLFALAMAAFFIGNLCFCTWEVLWGLDPAASIGNPWFVLFYLMLIAGTRLAILDRDVRLGNQQWAIVGVVVAIGMTIGCWLTTMSARAVDLPATKPILVAQVQEIERQPPQITTAPQLERQARLQPPPDWVVTIDRAMHPLVETFNLFYVLCDLVLLIFATIMLLGFWGGQLGLPWRTIGQAVLCFYIADTWFAYANDRVQGYESGFIIEVFWVFGIVQFGIAAALEFDNSIRARRLARRRTAIN